MFKIDIKLWESAYLKYYFLQHDCGILWKFDLAIAQSFGDLGSVNSGSDGEV